MRLRACDEAPAPLRPEAVAASASPLLTAITAAPLSALARAAVGRSSVARTLLEPPAAFGQVALQVPEPPQRGCQPESSLAVA